MKNAPNTSGLRRELGLFSATILVIANMVGTGIFTTSGFILEELGSPRAPAALLAVRRPLRPLRGLVLR